uniref:TM2 domain-containing protein n=1 Tax=Noctiluca scintillans TaxID=2966 RepID=A0A7S1AQT9_NOCSC|mmetsp:Transcript_56209/g.150097  ORF Transcript_56209/g.150097 Transcript_56209/m.150097 type:complete len:197 (+) Transcript_56209:48-638(+)
MTNSLNVHMLHSVLMMSFFLLVRGEIVRKIPDDLAERTGVFLNATSSMEYELHLEEVQMKSKFVMVLLCLSGLGCCGADRCYLGDCGMGWVKGLTLGGCGFWATVDFVAILINTLQMKESIDVLGMRANFWPQTERHAFYLMVADLTYSFGSCLFSFCGGLVIGKAVNSIQDEEPYVRMEPDEEPPPDQLVSEAVE